MMESCFDGVAKQLFYDRLKEQMAAGDTTVGFTPRGAVA
jgi:hypothetical protein